MQTIMLCCCGVFSTAMRWSPTRLTTPKPSTALLASSSSAVLERRIAPGLGDDAGADMRTDLGLVGLDQRVDGGGVEIAFLGQHGFERADAQLHFGQFRAVVVMMIVVR